MLSLGLAAVDTHQRGSNIGESSLQLVYLAHGALMESLSSIRSFNLGFLRQTLVASLLLTCVSRRGQDLSSLAVAAGEPLLPRGIVQ